MAETQAVFSRTGSAGRRNVAASRRDRGMAAVSSRHRRAREIGPDLWAGCGSARDSAGRAYGLPAARAA